MEQPKEYYVFISYKSEGKMTIRTILKGEMRANKYALPSRRMVG